MKNINTNQKDWQKQMEGCMRNEEVFILITENEDLANKLVSGDNRIGLIKIIMFGGTSIVGVQGIASLAAGTGIMALADPEPVSKTVLAVICAICIICGCFFVYRLIKYMISKKYKFEYEYDGIGKTFKVKATPA